MPDPIFIAGPTASGKSAIALLLAERLGGEIISVDSMQVYRGLDIGTAKPAADQLAQVPHHLIDVVDVDEAFDVGQFLQLARKAEEKISECGHVPIFCGGTGLYFKAWVAGIGETPPSDQELRSELDATDPATLLDELKMRDPETFNRVDRSNPRRVVRAIEVIRLTGRKYSDQRASWQAGGQTGLWIGLERGRNELVERINRRVDEMFERGLIDETRRLLTQGLDQNRTAMQALGYRQAVEYLQGARDLPQTIELVKQKTRQFAKRQMTWFRRQLELNWLPLERDANVSASVERILAALNNQPPATI